MTDREKNNGKNLLIVMAMLVILIIGSIGAYFTATDEATNSFTVGKIDVEITEPTWEALADTDENDIPDVAEAVLPNQLIEKDPMVTNTSDANDAFVFVKVTVPKADIYTANIADGNKAKQTSVTQLFQLNNADNTKAGNGKAWNGNDTFNADSWYLIKSNTEGDDVNEYIFAYGSSTDCTVLAAGETTEEPVFSSVTFCNAISGQDLELSTQNITIEAYAIQANDLTSSDKTEPAAIWAILSAQGSVGA